MNNKNTRFSQLFASFKQEAELPELSFDSANNCEMMYADGQPVTMHYDAETDRLTIFSPSVDIQGHPNREELLFRLMRANFFWMATRGYTLMLPPDRDQLVVMGRFDARSIMDAEHLSELLYACVEVARDWKELSEDVDELQVPEMPGASGDAEDEEEEPADFTGADLELHPWKYLRV